MQQFCCISNNERGVVMTNQEILSKVDHTLLKVESTWADIKQIVDDGMKYDTASVCIPASFVKQAADYIKEQGGHLKVCTVIGFPNGYSTTAAKCFEAHDAVENGAEEVDMVINVGWAKEGRWDDILDEINAIKAKIAFFRTGLFISSPYKKFQHSYCINF